MKRNFLILGLILLFSGLVCQVEAQHNINQVRAQSVKYQRLMALIMPSRQLKPAPLRKMRSCSGNMSPSNTSSLL